LILSLTAIGRGVSSLGSGTVSAFLFSISAEKDVAHLFPTIWTGWKRFTTVKRLQMFSRAWRVVQHAIKPRELWYNVPRLVLGHFHIINLAKQSLRPNSKHDRDKADADAERKPSAKVALSFPRKRALNGVSLQNDGKKR
jgi:hypothetical protein